ncbi:MAG: formylglycine-generating enzyme family protein [Bacteroides sp.]|nr:formylglycine-generating enzyme family protein [Ruminococcus flavefaciens]MCM1555591.1 formylglycine-generating enzyme family protein [Bacteroides sp.]
MEKLIKAGFLSLMVLVFMTSCEKEKGQERHENYTETAFGMSMDMVYVEGGSFMMGATEEQGAEVNEDEMPVRDINIGSYYIGKYEVTQSEWEAVMGTSLVEQGEQSFYYEIWGMRGEGPDYPMYYVSWEDAQEFCKKLSERTGKKYVLPTEAQWEYAARGGKNSKGYKFSGGDDIEEVAHYHGNGDGQNHPVGTKAGNELGIFDMSGNVWEWCADWYGPYSESETNNPSGPDEGEDRVVRGGSCFDYEATCRVARRNYDYPDNRFIIIGFRIARIL